MEGWGAGSIIKADVLRRGSENKDLFIIRVPIRQEEKETRSIRAYPVCVAEYRLSVFEADHHLCAEPRERKVVIFAYERISLEGLYKEDSFQQRGIDFDYLTGRTLCEMKPRSFRREIGCGSFHDFSV